MTTSSWCRVGAGEGGGGALSGGGPCGVPLGGRTRGGHGRGHPSASSVNRHKLKLEEGLHEKEAPQQVH